MFLNMTLFKMFSPNTLLRRTCCHQVRRHQHARVYCSVLAASHLSYMHPCILRISCIRELRTQHACHTHVLAPTIHTHTACSVCVHTWHCAHWSWNMHADDVADHRLAHVWGHACCRQRSAERFAPCASRDVGHYVFDFIQFNAGAFFHWHLIISLMHLRYNKHSSTWQ